ncbi:c-type cytochrome domain-containing protein [Singulisphaera sp. PoT]|uniref:WD40 domain-containing protein n=1 Tax=Singulisphaera sp. PoT TaxID=3411797 RepID=UPI003BF5E476
MALPLCLAALILGTAAPTPLEVAVPTRKEPVSYAKEIADILDAKCVGCHSSNLAESKLNIEDMAGMLKGGKRGPSLIPGKADESLLFQLAAHRLDPVMPPKDKKGGEAFTPAELGLLKLWIDAGAKDDSAENGDEPKSLELGTLPPGVQPVVAVDLTQDGSRIAAGRANVVQVHDADSGLVINSLGGHKDIIQSIRFSPDGKRLAAGSYQIVTLWNLPTGALAGTFAGHADQVKAIAIVDGGKAAYSGGLDRTLRSWSLADGKEASQWSLPGQVISLAPTPDGKSFAAGFQDGVIQVVNRADGKPFYFLRSQTQAITGLAFTPDAKHLVAASVDGSARIWTLPTEDAIKMAAGNSDAVKSADPVVIAGHKGAINGVALTPDGQTVITAGEDAAIRFWQVADGKAIRAIEGTSGSILASALSPDGQTILTGSADRHVRLIDVASGAVRRVMGGYEAAVNAVAFSPKGERFASAGADGSLKVWEAANGQGIVAFAHLAPNAAPTQAILKVAFLDENSLVSASADHTLKKWTFEGGWSEMKPLGPHVFRVLALDFSPDGTLLATGGGDPSRSGEVKIWNVQTGALVKSLDSLHSDTVFGVRFSPDGTKLATAAADKFLKVVNVADGKELRSFEGHTHHVMAVDWSADGKQLVTGGADNVMKVWDFESGEQLRTLQPAGKQITALRWIAGKPEVAGASGDSLVRLWNPDNGGIYRNYGGPSNYVFGVGISKDGKRMVAGGADSFLFLWNVENAQVLRKIGPPAP